MVMYIDIVDKLFVLNSKICRSIQSRYINNTWHMHLELKKNITFFDKYTFLL